MKNGANVHGSSRQVGSQQGKVVAVMMNPTLIVRQGHEGVTEIPGVTEKPVDVEEDHLPVRHQATLMTGGSAKTTMAGEARAIVKRNGQGGKRSGRQMVTTTENGDVASVTEK